MAIFKNFEFLNLDLRVYCHSEPAGEESDTQCRPEAIAEGSQPLRSFGITLRPSALRPQARRDDGYLRQILRAGALRMTI